MARIPNTIQVAGKRKTCRIYDAGDQFADRYTIAFKGYRLKDWGMIYPYLSASENPYHPQGVGQHGEAPHPMTGRHLGKRVSFDSLPEPVQRFILMNI